MVMPKILHRFGCKATTYLQHRRHHTMDACASVLFTSSSLQLLPLFFSFLFLVEIMQYTQTQLLKGQEERKKE